MAKKNTTEMVDLEKEVLLRISGEPKKMFAIVFEPAN